MFKSIKFHIIICFSTIFVVGIAFIGTVGYIYFSNVLTNEILSYSSRIVDESRLNVDSYFNQTKTYLQILSSNEVVIDILKRHQNSIDYKDKLYFDREIERILLDVMKFNSNIKDYIIIGNEGTVLYSSEFNVRNTYDFYEQGWFPQYLYQYSKVSFIGIHPQGYYMDDSYNKGNVISAVVPVIDFMSPNKRILGMILCNINTEQIKEINRQTVLEKTGTLLVMDDNSQIIHRPEYYKMDSELQNSLIQSIDGKKSGKFVLNLGGEKMVTVFSTSEVTNWKIIALVPQKEIMDHLDGIRIFLIILMVVIIIVINAASVIISGRITKPITRLIIRMGSIEKGDFNIKLYDDSVEEIKTLSSRIDLMIERINILNRDIYLYQIRSKDANIKALQAQINPHFLFNALQSIKAMAVCGKDEEVSRMVTLMGNILRYATYDMQAFVTIQDEIDHIHQYLQLQDYRYPGLIRIETDCSSELKDVRILKLILQPIVENCINHGFYNGRKGTITINVKRVEDDVEIRICDDGIGMDEKEMSNLVQYLGDTERKDDSSSIGLKNVHDRLRLKFGGIYGINMTSGKEEGTCVSMLIPFSDENI